METLGMYLFKSAVWLTGFTLVFLVVLRNEQFFRLNRIYLLSGIIASIIFPFFTWHYAVILPLLPQAEVSLGDLTPVAVVPETPAVPFYWYFYLSGILFFVFRLIRQTWLVVRKLKKAGYVKNGSVKLVRTHEYASSFSFFSFVFVNPSTTDVEMKEIVNHESGHIQQWHWFDLLLVEFLCMLQWFNPFVWVYSRLVRQNHEYLADQTALQRTSDPAIYHATLLNQMLGVPVICLANSFSYSLNKKRFKMMKKRIESPFRKLKLLLVLPLVAFVFYAFAKPEYIAPINVQTNGPGIQTNTGDIVKGQVLRKSDGKPMSGATVIIKGTTVGTITDTDGNFILKGVPVDGEIVVSFVGLATAEAKPVFGQPMVINMEGSTVGLEQITVVGYGEKKKPETYTDKFDPKNPPLYYVDGVPTWKGRFEKVLAKGVESVTIWKGQEALDKFGEKGKNGVIEVVTQKNTSNASSISKATPVVLTNPPPPPPPAPSLENIGFNDPKNPPLCFVDGVATDKSEFDKILSEGIESVNVLKGEHAIAKYGEKGKNGAIEVTTKHPPVYILDGKTLEGVLTDQIKPEDIESIDVLKAESGKKYYGEKGKYGVILITSKKKGVQIKNADVNKNEPAMYLVDGVEKTSAEVKNIDPNRIESVNVLKGDYAVKNYGEKARDGVVEIKLKGSVKADSSKFVVGFPIDPKIKFKSANGSNFSGPKDFDAVKVLGYGTQKPQGEKDIFVVVEEMPEFPGGSKALRSFLAQQIRYPVDAQKDKIQGKVFVNFVVGSDGNVSNAKVVKSVHPSLDAEALRVVGLLPAWKPGKQHGQAVDVAYTMPIEFVLQ